MSGVNSRFMAESERVLGHEAMDFFAHGFFKFYFGHEGDKSPAHGRKSPPRNQTHSKQDSFVKAFTQLSQGLCRKYTFIV